MATGPDGDDDEEAIEIEVEPAPVEPEPGAPASAEPGAPATAEPDAPVEIAPEASAEAVLDEAEIEIEAGPELEPRTPPPRPPPPEFKHAPLSQAAAGDRDPELDIALYESEAQARPEAARRAVLLAEVAWLREQVAEARAVAEGEGGAPAPAALPATEIVDAARAAFAADPSFLAGFWALRRLLAATEGWQELEAAYGAVLASASLAPGDRADLSVERGRVLEDRLGRDEEAIDAYRGALAASPEHETALLALYLAGARTGARDAIAAALEGLVRRESAPARRAGLAAALARVQRGVGISGGEPPAGGAFDEERALETLRAALAGAGADPAAPVAVLIEELDVLARGGRAPAVRAGALAELAQRISPVDPPLGAALLRERARLEDDAAALETLREAARLAPAHQAVAAALIDVGERLDRPEVMAEAVATFAGASADVHRIADLVLRRAEALGRRGRTAEALAALETLGPHAARGAEEAALRAALLVRGHDLGGLADALEAETAGLVGAVAAWALTFAGATRQWAGGATKEAEVFYRRALEAAPAYRPATDALDALLRAEGRGSERAALLEGALGTAAHPDPVRETWLLEELVALYRDDLALPDRARAHQERLVAAAPDDVRRRARLLDLELAVGAPVAGTLRALAAAAGHPAVTAALQVEAAVTLLEADTDAGRAEAEPLLDEALPADGTGLAAGALEAARSDPDGRATAVAEELAALAGQASPETVRALRFRLAHHLVSAGRFAEAIAALTPLRSDGDPLARAWSWDLARRSGEAILEVAVLSDEAADASGAPPSDVVVAARGDVLVALGEALERAGDPGGAADTFRKAMGAAAGAHPHPDVAAGAALGLLRVAAVARAPSPSALPEALAAVAAACAGEPRLRAAAEREAALVRVTTGSAEAAPEALGAATAGTDAGWPAARADAAVLRFLAGARRGDAAAVAEGLFELAAGMGPPRAAAAATAATAAAPPPEAVPLYARAAARARLAGSEIAEDVHRRVWRATHAPELGAALADLPVAPGAGWPADRPDPRRARASRAQGALGVALDLEAALDAERRGALGAALGDYGRVIAAAPERLEAWEGIRRVAHAGGDLVGEARALARLGTLVKTSARAAAFFSEGARLFEAIGRLDEAMTLWGKALEARPDDDHAFSRLHGLLAADLDTPGRAAALDRLLSHRLGALPLADDVRAPLLLARARNRITPLGDLEGAAQDFKRILKIDPEHGEALWDLAHLAIEAREPGAAAPLLARFIAVASAGGHDDDRVADARLELGACWEAVGRRQEAIETLRQAAELGPGDPAPLGRLAELYLGAGDWRSAVEALRASEPRLPDAPARAALHLRIGGLLRDLGRDSAGAALSFRTAAELEPLGDGTRALVALHDALDDMRGARQTIEREITRCRQALGEDPLGVAWLDRLAEFLDELARRAPDEQRVRDARAAVTEIRTIATRTSAGAFRVSAGAPRPLVLRGAESKGGGAFWTDLAYPGALGFLAEIWPHLTESALALYPPPEGAVPARGARIAAGAEPRAAWIETTAASIGLGGLRLYHAGPGASAGLVAPLLEAEPALVLGEEALDGSPEARFRIGRALALLRDRTVGLEWMTARDLAAVLAAAAITTGATPPSPSSERPPNDRKSERASERTSERISAPAPSEAALKTMARVMSRRDRKALGLQASRFGFEAPDTTRWRHAVLRTADRLGLLLAGDVAAAAGAAAGLEPGATASREALRENGRARELLAFALGEAYPVLRREAGVAS